MRRHGPYVGVSGVTTPEQAQALLDAWPADAPPQSLMIGVLASEKTMSGGECNARSPRPAAIFKVCPVDKRSLNLVHYFTKNPDTLCRQLVAVVNMASQLRCDGVQINVSWPEVEQLAEFRCAAPEWMRIVLQIRRDALRDTVNPARLIGALSSYGSNITDVLLDPSGGRGEPLDLSQMGSLVRELRRALPRLGIGIAGGLCAETLHAVADLVHEHRLSIDAEGRLRNERDELDLDKARAYLRAAAPLVCGDGW